MHQHSHAPHACTGAHERGRARDHGSTFIHFVDIGFMNAVISYYPVRLLAQCAAAYAGGDERHMSLPFAAFYAGLVVFLVHSAVVQTRFFHRAFPTGRAVRSFETPPSPCASPVAPFREKKASVPS